MNASAHIKGLRSRIVLSVLAVSAALSVCVLSACNTTEGVGKDIKAAGRGIENTANDAKN